MSFSTSVLTATLAVSFVANAIGAEEPLTLKGHTKEVTGVVVGPDAKFVAAAALDGKVRIWELPSGKLLHTLDADGKGVYALALSKDGKRLASAGADKLIRLWDPAPARKSGSSRGTRAGWRRLPFRRMESCSPRAATITSFVSGIPARAKACGRSKVMTAG